MNSKQVEQLLSKTIKKIVSDKGIDLSTRKGNKELGFLVRKIAKHPFSSSDTVIAYGEKIGEAIADLSQQRNKTCLDHGVVRQISFLSEEIKDLSETLPLEKPKATPEAKVEPEKETPTVAKTETKTLASPPVVNKPEVKVTPTPVVLEEEEEDEPEAVITPVEEEEEEEDEPEAVITPVEEEEEDEPEAVITPVEEEEEDEPEAVITPVEEEEEDEPEAVITPVEEEEEEEDEPEAVITPVEEEEDEPEAVITPVEEEEEEEDEPEAVITPVEEEEEEKEDEKAQTSTPISLKDRLSEDIKTAMKAQDKIRLETVRFLKKVVLEKEVSVRPSGQETLTPEQEMDVLTQQAKQRRDSIEQYQKGGREDLADKEAQELAIIETYLPKQLSDEELEAIITNIIESVGATSAKDIGKVMGSAMQQLKGKADGKKVQSLVKSLLET